MGMFTIKVGTDTDNDQYSGPRESSPIARLRRGDDGEYHEERGQRQQHHYLSDTTTRHLQSSSERLLEKAAGKASSATGLAITPAMMALVAGGAALYFAKGFLDAFAQGLGWIGAAAAAFLGYQMFKKNQAARR